MILDYNKRSRCQIQDHTSMVATPNQNLLWDNNSKPHQDHFHGNDPPPDNSPTETSTQTMVHECLSDGGMDPSDINNVMSAFKAKTGHPPQETSRKINAHQ